MSANRGVQTRAIKEAVKGREAEILDALQIDWRSGQLHITCPYPRHAATAGAQPTGDRSDAHPIPQAFHVSNSEHCENLRQIPEHLAR